MECSAQNIKKIIAGGLLILFVGYVCSITLFYHSHNVSGQVVSHSHPYSDAPDTGRHTHSFLEFATIASLSVLLMLAALCWCAFIQFTSGLVKKSAFIYGAFLDRNTFYFPLRGPPSL